MGQEVQSADIELTEDEVEEEWEEEIFPETIYIKYAISTDGCETLEDVAKNVDGFAEWLRTLHKEGHTLTETDGPWLFVDHPEKKQIYTYR